MAVVAAAVDPTSWKVDCAEARVDPEVGGEATVEVGKEVTVDAAAEGGNEDVAGSVAAADA